jgi:hypothetical protein
MKQSYFSAQNHVGTTVDFDRPAFFKRMAYDVNNFVTLSPSLKVKSKENERFVYPLVEKHWLLVDQVLCQFFLKQALRTGWVDFYSMKSAH